MMVLLRGLVACGGGAGGARAGWGGVTAIPLIPATPLPATMPRPCVRCRDGDQPQWGW